MYHMTHIDHVFPSLNMTKLNISSSIDVIGLYVAYTKFSIRYMSYHEIQYKLYVIQMKIKKSFREEQTSTIEALNISAILLSTKSYLEEQLKKSTPLLRVFLNKKIPSTWFKIFHPLHVPFKIN